MIKNNYNLDYVKDEYKKREQESLKKMYPNEDTENKYILFVESELWFPYLSENISATIDFIYEADIKHYKNKLRTPYPNKTITTISMVNGRKVCDLGLPIIFDSYEDLSKLKSVLIKWELDIVNNDNILEKCYIQILYDITFKYVENNRIYSLYSKDTLPQCYKDKKLAIKYLDEFDKTIYIKNSGTDEISVEYLTGKETDENIIEEESFVTIMTNMGTKEFIDVAQNNKKFMIFSYYKTDILEPDFIAKDIPH